MIRLELSKPVRVTVDLVDTLTKWVLGSTVLFSIFLTLFLIIKSQNKDPASKLVRFRNQLALFFSANVFYKVIQDPEQSSSESINDLELLAPSVVHEHQKHSCYTQKVLITSVFGKNTFYSLFILSLPLHAVVICLIILQKIFVNEIDLESCASYMLSDRDHAYYYCRLMNETLVPPSMVQENIVQLCNSTAVNGTYIEKIDQIICTQYYFDKTKIIEIITNIVVWQKLSATVSVYLVRYFQYLFRRCFTHAANHRYLVYCIPAFIILGNISFVVIGLLLYLLLGNVDTRSILTLDFVGAASGTLVYVFISMNVYTWIVRDRNKYQRCMFQVGVTTYK